MARCLRGVQFLLARGADPDGSMVNYCFPETAQFGAYSVLGYAASVGETEICQALVGKGAIPWKADSLGETPLIDACRRSHLKTAQYLLTIDNGRSDIQKCLDASVKANNLDLVKLFTDSKATPKSSTWLAAMRDVKPDLRPTNLAIIDLLVSLAPTEATDPGIVLAAIDSGNFVGISRLLELRGGILGFDVNATFENRRWPKTEPLNCTGYAEKQNAISFVVLLKSYGWQGAEASTTHLREMCSLIKSPQERGCLSSYINPPSAVPHSPMVIY